jgi:AcrR family transcriptional regulator
MKAKAHDTARDGGRGVRERIVSAALSILRETGIRAVSQVQVARRAGVRQSHVTYYFPTRHDLVEAVCVRFVDGVVSRARELAARRAGEGDLAAVVGQVAVAIADEEHMRMFLGVIVEADGDPAIRAILVRETLRLQSTLAEQLGGKDALERAGLVLGSLWGVGLYEFVVRRERGAAVPSSFLAELIGAARRGRATRPASGRVKRSKGSKRRRDANEPSVGN